MRANHVGWRLDHLLASAPVAARARARAVAGGVGTSDHAPVVTTLTA